MALGDGASADYVEIVFNLWGSVPCQCQEKLKLKNKIFLILLNFKSESCQFLSLCMAISYTGCREGLSQSKNVRCDLPKKPVCYFQIGCSKERG